MNVFMIMTFLVYILMSSMSAIYFLEFQYALKIRSLGYAGAFLAISAGFAASTITLFIMTIGYIYG